MQALGQIRISRSSHLGQGQGYESKKGQTRVTKCTCLRLICLQLKGNVVICYYQLQKTADEACSTKNGELQLTENRIGLNR